MFRIDTPSAAAALPAPAAAGTPGYFTGGNPSTATPPTILDVDFMNMLMLELLNVVVAGGLSPSKTSYTQVRDAIANLIANSTIPSSRQIATSGLASGGGNLTADRTIAVLAASAAEADAAAIANKALVPTSLVNILASIAAKAASSRQVVGAGLATGGGDLTADRTITVPKASGSDVQAGTNDTKAITPAALAAGYQGSLSGTGWMRHPNGFIEQWGAGSHDSAGIATITFPIAFPNAPFGAIASNNAGPPAPAVWQGIGGADLTTTGMTIYSAVSSGVAPTVAGVASFWRAWGR